MGAALMLAVAITLSGECGPIGPRCEMAVARTMANRLADPAFPATVDGVLSAYYGKAVPTESAIGFAALVVYAPERVADGGARYAYSNEDRLTMGWRFGDEVICGAGLCVHLTSDWPGG